MTGFFETGKPSADYTTKEWQEYQNCGYGKLKTYIHKHLVLNKRKKAYFNGHLQTYEYRI